MHALPTTRPSEPRLSAHRNLTPFRIFRTDKMGPGRHGYDVLVARGTFDLVRDVLPISAVQAPVVLADRVHDPDDAERSSLAAAGDVLLHKPRTDVFVTGTARTHREEPRPSWSASVAVHAQGEVIVQSTAQVHGPRTFRYSALRGWHLGESAPTGACPIRYERAYGGHYLDEDAQPAGTGPRRVVHRENPSGVGHWHERSLDPARAYPGPQWTSPTHDADRLLGGAPVVGFGPVARWWAPRLAHAGTYDEAWLGRTRAEHAQGIRPDYADDFDPMFFQCAPAPLITPRWLRGDESLMLMGLSPEAEAFGARLPGIRLMADLLVGAGSWVEEPFALDTVHVDLDAARVHLTWRMTLSHHQDVRKALVHSPDLA